MNELNPENGWQNKDRMNSTSNINLYRCRRLYDKINYYWYRIDIEGGTFRAKQKQNVWINETEANKRLKQTKKFK